MYSKPTPVLRNFFSWWKWPPNRAEVKPSNRDTQTLRPAIMKST